jgi:hypothetical protein
VRPLLLAAALLFAATGTALAAPRQVPATVLIVTDVGESGQPIMPAALWRKLVIEYVGARTVTAEDGTSLPDDTHCHSAKALYAVLATFDRATRLPGLAQDTDRVYGVARFTVRNCLTGMVSPTKTVRLESDPPSEASRGDFEPGPRTWDRAIRTALAHDPLVLTTVARIIRVDGAVVFLESGGGFSLNQVLRVFADANAKPYANPIELVVLDIAGKYVQATVTGKGTPRVGDYVEASQK